MRKLHYRPRSLSRGQQQANLHLHRLKGFDHVADIDHTHTDGMKEQASLR